MVRALGADVRIEHWKSHDGTKEIGAIRPDTGLVSQDWTHGSLYEAAIHYKGKRK